MLRTIKRIITSTVLTAAVLVSAGMLVTATAHAADSTDAAKNAVCIGVKGEAGGNCGDGGANLTKIVKTVINVLSLVGGVVAVIMIILGGLKYITSGGDAQAVGGAKKTIIGAIIGLVIISFAQFIVHFVLKNAQK